MPSWAAQRTCWHEAAVPVGSSSRIVSVLSEKKKSVVVSARPSGTQDPKQALESVSEKNRTRFSKISGIVLFSLLPIVFSIVPITATRHNRSKLLETLFGCASSPCPRVGANVVRTAATLRMTGSAEFCHCVHTKCSDRGTWIAFPSADCWMRRLSVFVTFAMPSGAPRLAETNRFPLSVGSRLEPMWKPNTAVS